MKTPHFTLSTAFRSGLFAAALSLCLFGGAALAQEGNKNVGGEPRSGDVARQAPAAPELKFDVEVTTGSGSTPTVLKEQETGLTLMAPNDAPPESAAAAQETRAPNAPAPGGAPAAVEAAAGETMTSERRAIFEAMAEWQKANLATYTYTIASLYDPFMPIKEVRGKPDTLGGLSEEEEANLPPILKLELSQLKLVAITSVTGRESASLASFEDGVGSSYILRQNDRIGRRKGRIIRIEPTQVVVEEAPRGSSATPEITVIKLDVLDNSGLTYSGAN